MQANISEIMESIQGEGLLVGTRQIFLRFTGCNLRCSYCDTSWSFKKAEKCRLYLKTGSKNPVEDIENPVSTAQLKKLIKHFNSPWISFTGGEPLLWADYIREVTLSLKPKGYRFLLESNGTLYKQLAVCIPCIDMVSMDFKLPSATGQNLWKSHRLFLLKAREKPCYIKIVITGESSFQEVAQAVDIIKNVDASIPLILQPATPFNTSYAPLIENVLKMQEMALEKLKDVRILPQVHRLINLT